MRNRDEVDLLAFQISGKDEETNLTKLGKISHVNWVLIFYNLVVFHYGVQLQSCQI